MYLVLYIRKGEKTASNELRKGEIIHSEKINFNYDKLNLIWEPFLKSDVFCLGVVFAKYALEMQKMAITGVRETLTEGSLGWNCFGL